MSKSATGLWGQWSGEQGIWEETGRTRISSQGRTCRIPKWIKGAKVRTRNRNVIEMKQGPLQREWDKGGIKDGPWEMVMGK